MGHSRTHREYPVFHNPYPISPVLLCHIGLLRLCTWVVHHHQAESAVCFNLQVKGKANPLTVHASFKASPPAHISPPAWSKYLSTFVPRTAGSLSLPLQSLTSTMGTVTCFCGFVGASLTLNPVSPQPATRHLINNVMLLLFYYKHIST